MLRYVISCHVMSCRVVSCHVMSCRTRREAPTTYETSTKHLQNASKEYGMIKAKQQTILSKASILTCFWALEPVRWRLGDHLGMGTLKTSKKWMWGTLLLEHIRNICWYFCGDVFLMFSEPPSFHLCAPIDTDRTQFWKLLATKFSTDWANLEKWKLRFRARRSIKIKLQGASSGTDFVISVYICSKPVFFVSPDLFLSHSSKFGYPFGLYFGQYIPIIWKLIFKH
jgi:hypothetical protein